MRDEKKVSLEEAHFRLSALPAHAAGFRDRGMLREGAPADVVVYELESLEVRAALGRARSSRTFPAASGGGCSRSDGYKAILVNGEVTFEDGECTGATPGKLLRHGRG